MPAAEEATAYGLEAAAEEEEYEECAIEEAAAEEPAAEPAPAEAAIVTQETAAPEAPAEDVAEAPAAEEAEVFTESEAMASRMIPDTVIRYNGTAYEPADHLLDILPEGCEEAGAVSGAADAVWYAEDVALHGAVVWQPDSGEDVFYVEFEDGYLTYWRAP